MQSCKAAVIKVFCTGDLNITFFLHKNVVKNRIGQAIRGMLYTCFRIDSSWEICCCGNKPLGQKMWEEALREKYELKFAARN